MQNPGAPLSEALRRSGLKREQMATVAGDPGFRRRVAGLIRSLKGLLKMKP
jgi:hypothetical protein